MSYRIKCLSWYNEELNVKICVRQFAEFNEEMRHLSIIVFNRNSASKSMGRYFFKCCWYERKTHFDSRRIWILLARFFSFGLNLHLILWYGMTCKVLVRGGGINFWKHIYPWPRFGGKDGDGHKSWLAFRVSRGQSLRGNRNVTLGLSSSMGRSDETKQNQYTTLEEGHMPEQLMSGFFLKEALLHVEMSLEHSFSTQMHRIHSSLIPWQINCPVANTFKFSNLESWGSIRCIAVVSDQSNIWHFDSVPWCRNSAFLFIYFPGQWTKLCLQQDITASIASVRFIDQIDTREERKYKLSGRWCEDARENVF